MKRPPRLELTREQRKVAEALGRIGGEIRAKKLTPQRRLEIACKASKAAAEARTRKAKARLAERARLTKKEKDQKEAV